MGKQFLSLLLKKCNLRHEGLRSFSENLDFLERNPKELFLRDDIFRAIDAQRVDLNEMNVRNMHGMSDAVNVSSFDWIEFMNDVLMDCSLFRVPINAALEYGGDIWEYSFVHFVAGRTK